MSRDLKLSTEHLESPDQLVDWLRRGSKEPAQRRVGTEHERFLLREADLSSIGYDGADGVRRIFELLAESDRYDVQYDAGNPVALVERNGPTAGASITIEPGGQLELSGAPYRQLPDTEREPDAHHARLYPP